jgi:hypothetical protein
LWPFYASGLYSSTFFLLLLYLEDVFAVNGDGIALHVQENNEGIVGRLQTSG